jgi:UDP-N-acetylmuramoyl-tripeptide--D-alanyl-D-alanine ligase
MRIVTATHAQVLGRPPFGAFTSVSTDTRTLEPGALFIALRGETFDGHGFLEQAEAAGALAAVVDAEGAARNTSGLPVYIVSDTTKALGDLASAYRRQFDIPVIGITGSVGKTTTKDFVAAILGTAGPVVATRENENNEIGVPQTLFRITEETTAVVIEMGMRGPGQIAELARIAEPTCGIITAVGKTHAEFFPNGEEGVANAKAELLDALSETAPAALPADSDWYRSVLQHHARGPVTTFGFGEGSDVRAEHYRLEDGAGVFRIVTPDGAVDVRLPTPGRHLAWNAAAAFCAALWRGIPPATAARALEGVSLGKHRLQVRTTPDGLTVIDDAYNAGPESMRAALAVLRDWPAARRVAVLGDMRELGSDAEAEHRALGREAASGVDALVTLGDLARYISDAAVEAGLGDTRHAESHEEALAHLRAIDPEGTVILVKASRALDLDRLAENLSGAESAD